MTLIAAVDKNWGIGRDNHLLISIPEDMAFFKKTTINNVVVMGKKTLDSLPSGNPLKNRTNIVLTHNSEFRKNGVTIFNDLDTLLKSIKRYDKESVFCIGGASIYKQLLPYCDKALITKIDKDLNADIFLPNLDKLNEWEIEEESEQYKFNDISYSFVTYLRH